MEKGKKEGRIDRGLDIHRDNIFGNRDADPEEKPL